MSNDSIANVIDRDVSFDEMNTVISAVRKTYNNVLSEYNNKMYRNLVDCLGNEKPEIIMMSMYAPNID